MRRGRSGDGTLTWITSCLYSRFDASPQWSFSTSLNLTASEAKRTSRCFPESGSLPRREGDPNAPEGSLARPSCEVVELGCIREAQQQPTRPPEEHVLVRKTDRHQCGKRSPGSKQWREHRRAKAATANIPEDQKGWRSYDRPMIQWLKHFLTAELCCSCFAPTS